MQLNRGDIESIIQPLDITSRKSCQNHFTNPIPGIQQSGYIKNKIFTTANIIHLVPATFWVSKSHIYIVTVLANLNIGYNNFYLDEPLTIKKAMAILYWNDFEKVMHTKFQSLFENNIWEYKNVSLSRAVLTGC